MLLQCQRGRITVKDMIARIIEMDGESRRLTKQVQESRVKSQQEVEHQKEKMWLEYLEKARRRVEKNKGIEQKYADEHIAKIVENQAAASRRLDNMYLQKKDMWVRMLVERVLGE